MPPESGEGAESPGPQRKRRKGDGLMLEELRRGPKVAGVKQTKRAIQDGTARLVFLAQDADPRVVDPIAELCRERAVPVDRAAGMKELGSACGIAVGSAAAALLS